MATFARHRAIRWLTAALALCAAAFAPGCGDSGDSPGITAEPQGEQDATRVRIPGRLEAADAVLVTRRSLVSDDSLTAITKIVPEGSFVEEGDLLFEIDSTEMERRAEKAEADVKDARLKEGAARARLAALQAELSAERETGPARLASSQVEVERLKSLPDTVELSGAESEVARLGAALARAAQRRTAVEPLVEHGAASETAAVRALYGHGITAAELDHARAHLESVRRGADAQDLAVAELTARMAELAFDLEIAELEVKVAEANVEVQSSLVELRKGEERLRRTREQLAFKTLHAPVAGKVVYEKTYAGGGAWEKVSEGTSVRFTDPVVSVISGTAFQFRAKAPEELVGRMRSGLEAEVALDAVQDTVLRGRVERLDVELHGDDEKPQVSFVDLERPEAKAFDVVIALEDVPEGVMPGLSGEAVFTLDPEVDLQQGASEPHGEPSPPGVGPAPVRFAGYVDAMDKVALFTPTEVMGSITRLVPQYGTVQEGDVVMEATGDMAVADLRDVEDLPALAQKRLETAQTVAETDARRRELEIECARLELEVAELRLEKLLSLPHEADLRRGEANVEKARLEAEQASELLDAARSAGMDSAHDLAKLELGTALAEKDHEEEQCRLALIRRGAPERDVALARYRLDLARRRLDHAQKVQKQSAAVQEQLVACARVELENAQAEVRLARERLAKRVLRAPMAGNVVLGPHRYRSGRTMQVGDHLAYGPVALGYICNLNKLKFCAVVEQPYVARIRKGDQARVCLRATGNRPIKGQVDTIVPMIRDREAMRNPDRRPDRFSQVRSTRVDVVFEVPDELEVPILPGMTGAMEVHLHPAGAIPREPPQ